MNFRPELVERILTGQKTQTRRIVSDNPNSPWYREKCALRLGRAYAVCPGRGKPGVAKVALVEKPWRQKAGDINEQDARAEGFVDREAFISYWTDLHGSFDPDTEVWRIHFAQIHPDDYALWEGGIDPRLAIRFPTNEVDNA